MAYTWHFVPANFIEVQNGAEMLRVFSVLCASKFPTAGPVGFQSLGLGLARGDLQPSKSGMEPWNPGTLEPWNFGILQNLEPWNLGTPEPWNPGTPEPWNPETLEPWNPATVEP